MYVDRDRGAGVTLGATDLTSDLKKKRKDEKIGSLQDSLDWTIYYKEGLANVVRGKYEKAVELFDKVELHIRIVFQLLHTNKWINQWTWCFIDNKVIFCQSVFMVTDPQKLLTPPPQLYLSRATCHLNLAKPLLALSDANKALKIDESCVLAKIIKAESLYNLLMFEKSLVMFTQLLRIKPDNKVNREKI